jgi:hypothetical protein
MTYAACLRIYEPVAAFHVPERAVRDPARAGTEPEEVGRWLEEFHLPGGVPANTSRALFPEPA